MANNLSNKLRSHPYIVGAIALIVVFIALSYAGSLLLMKFNGLPLECNVLCCISFSCNDRFCNLLLH